MSKVNAYTQVQLELLLEGIKHGVELVNGVSLLHTYLRNLGNGSVLDPMSSKPQFAMLDHVLEF